MMLQSLQVTHLGLRLGLGEGEGLQAKNSGTHWSGSPALCCNNVYHFWTANWTYSTRAARQQTLVFCRRDRRI
jgi:hypothetical protein